MILINVIINRLYVWKYYNDVAIQKKNLEVIQNVNSLASGAVQNL